MTTDPQIPPGWIDALIDRYAGFEPFQAALREAYEAGAATGRDAGSMDYWRLEAIAEKLREDGDLCSERADFADADKFYAAERDLRAILNAPAPAASRDADYARGLRDAAAVCRDRAVKREYQAADTWPTIRSGLRERVAECELLTREIDALAAAADGAPVTAGEVDA